MTKRWTTEEIGDVIFLLAARPEGVRRDQTEFSTEQFKRGVKHLRTVFAGDDVNLIPTQEARDALWTYRWVGKVDEASPYMVNRLADSTTRLETIRDIWGPVARNSDGRTAVGKAAKKIHRHLNRLFEDLTENDDLTEAVDELTL